MDAKNFIKKIDEIKKENKLDLSVGEDLSIGIMNMVSLEEHFLFSYMKTQDTKYLKFLEQTREVRKRLLAKIVNKKEGDFSEQWCISKHLLSASMRFMEVGTKYLHEGKNSEAEDIFMDAFNMYSMFWEINGFLDSKKTKNFVANTPKFEKNKFTNISNKLKGILDCCKE